MKIIIFIVIGIIIGGIATYLELKSNEGKKPVPPTKPKTPQIGSPPDDTRTNSDALLAETRRRYETLLAEARSRCEALDRQLTEALEGNAGTDPQPQSAEADKLRQRVKDLEDDISDLEDDNDHLKSKLRKTESNVSDLEVQLSKEQKERNRLSDEIEEIKAQLDEKMEELKLKTASISFVQELLTAKELSTEDTQKIHRGIDFVESFIRGQYADLNAFLFSKYPDAGSGKSIEAKKMEMAQAFEQWASTKRKSWLDGKTTIALIGEFDAGKTSIVNRLLSQDNPSVPLLPVSMKAATAIPTYIAGSTAVSFSFVAGEGKRKVILEETFRKVSKELLEQIEGVSSLIKYFVMTYKNPNLDGMTLLDTPGFSSNDVEDRERTFEVINECDALFWVFDVNAGTINRSSISIIKELLNKPLYVVINKCDTKAKADIDSVEELIRKTLADEGLEARQIIRFSHQAPLDTIMEAIKGVSRDTTRDTFIADLGGEIEALLSLFDKKVKAANKAHAKATKEANDLTNRFVDCLDSLRKDCEEAYDIPHWETHLFSADRYEMSEYEGDHLRSLLEDISSDSIKTLASRFDARVEKAEEVQQLWSDLCDVKAAWQRIKDCQQQYKKIVKNL